MKRETILDFGKNLTVLYVENHLETQHMMLTFLQNYFDSIIAANDGKDGLKKLKIYQVDLIITDISMPHMDGIAMIEAIREYNEDIPVLVFSAYDDTALLHSAIKLGVDGYLLKPLDLQQFEQTLAKTIQQIKLRYENIEYKLSLEQKVHEQHKQLKKKELLLQEKAYLATHDQLTNVSNRRGLQEWFTNATTHHAQSGALTLIVLDIDNFKIINDQFGHHVGDTVLQKFGEILLQEVRKHDIAARWGGEEFVIILSQTDVRIGAQIAERIRHTIEATHFSPLQKVTASFGVVAYQKGESLEAFIHRGDNALYQAKNEGKNCVVCLD